jgi:N-acetylmuramoyl-L-alanine amidase
VTEAEVNLAVAQRVKTLLEAEGVVVDLLPATIPPAYDADAFLSIHADGNAGTVARGWKLATPWRASRASLQLMEAVAAAYGPATGMTEDVGGVTVNMRGYYAFNFRRHVHSVARTTPAIIVEMGFMTNAADRAILFNEPEKPARGIAEGVLNYLRQRDPNDGAALLPPDFPTMRAGPGGATLRSAPNDEARIIAAIDGEGRVFVFLREDNWYQVMVRIGESRLLGWIRVEQVEEAPAPTPTAVS